MNCLLDTNIINRLCDGKITLDAFPKEAKLYYSPIQAVEIEKTTCEIRRQDLLTQLAKVSEKYNNPKLLPPTLMWGVEGCGWGESCWSDDNGAMFNKLILQHAPRDQNGCSLTLQDIDRKIHLTRDQPSSNWNSSERRFMAAVYDCLIAEIAIKQNYILITVDRKLECLVSQHGGRTRLFSEKTVKPVF